MHITHMNGHSSHPGAAFRTQPRAHAQRGALVGGVAGTGGQSQPAGADLQAAGRPVWTCAGLQRLGERLWQTALGAAWSGPGYTWSPSGESSRVRWSIGACPMQAFLCEYGFSWSLSSNIYVHRSDRHKTAYTRQHNEDFFIFLKRHI